MEKFLRGLAVIGNLALLVVVFGLWTDRRPDGAENLLFLLLALTPVLNLWVMWSAPDREERALRRAVAKAELRKRLKELENNDRIS